MILIGVILVGFLLTCTALFIMPFLIIFDFLFPNKFNFTEDGKKNAVGGAFQVSLLFAAVGWIIYIIVVNLIQ